jgi:pullulanase
MVLTGQPIAFLHGGDERGRSKPKLNSKSEVIGDYVHNSYDSSDDINQFIWNVPKEYEAMGTWVSGVIAVRRAEEGLRIGDMATIDASMKQIQHADQLSMGWTVTYKSTTLVMLVNANFDQAIDFKTGLDLTNATVLVDDDEASPAGVTKVSGMTISGQTVTVEPLTAVMLKIK